MSLTLELEKLLPTNQEDDEEEEALSLCDLPISKPINQETHQQPQDSEVHDFAFHLKSSLKSIPLSESDICVADEVFSGGQILPFRHSVSSESGLTRLRAPARLGSCSSSRSSSTRSSTSTATSNSNSNSNSNGNSNFRVLRDQKNRNQFYSYPSPDARVRNSMVGRVSSCSSSSGSKMTVWQMLKLGLVRTPEIELQGRTNNSYMNKLSNNKNSGTKIGNLLNSNVIYDEKDRGKGSGGDNNGGFFKSCKCTVGAIEPLAITRINGNNSSPRSSKVVRSEGVNEDRQKRGRNGKEMVSNHRTFEWLRDLSHPNILNP